MTNSYSTQGTPSIAQLTDTQITNLQNNNLLQYDSTAQAWKNGNLDLSGQDVNLDEIDCRVLRVSETADITGRLANQGVASFVNDEFIFQNGVSNLGDTLYIDNVNNRIGIGVSEPTEDLELDGNIQLDTGGVQRGRVIFYDKQNDHEHAEVDGLGTGVNGGVLAFYTKIDTGTVTEKLRIDDVGAIGIGGANYGTSGQVLTSGGSGAPVSWTTPSGGGGGGITQYATFTYQPATEQSITTSFKTLEYDTVNISGGSDITLDITTNPGRITLASTGVYNISYWSTSTLVGGTARLIQESSLFVNPATGTFSQEIGTKTFTYSRQSADPENTASCTYLLNVSASNTQIELRFKTIDGSVNGRMKSECCGITIMKIA